ncbi:HAMP domain-containing histidine kinase [Rhizobium sp. CFBP 8762]|uniref:ATP-binding protein n=1 Tax=Rhizobium sp. CFBP 8762 TaxID=2775279 RepID=UPI00177F5FB2|nr:HAMP domain-containing histidine kinase [Rhizobium sp. CFBP 8762]
MRVLSNIAERLPPPAKPGRDRENAALRIVALCAGVGTVLVSAALSAVLPVSTALPVGAALVAALALIGGVVAVSVLRLTAISAPANNNVVHAGSSLRAQAYDCFAGLVTLHDARGSVVSVHGRDRAAMLGWMRDPMGRGFLEQVHVSDRILFLQAVDRLRLGASSARLDIRMDRARLADPRSQFAYLRCQMTALADVEGELTGILVQSTTIDSEAALRAEVAEKTSAADAANEAKTRFLAAVSHELRTPLTAILGFSDSLAHGYCGDLGNDRQREYVGLIHQSGTHLLALVNSMLDMTRIESGHYRLSPEPFAVADAVLACEAMLSGQARDKGVSLTSRVPRLTGEVVTDRRAFQQILINLIGNALKFTAKGGVVTVDAARTADTMVLTVSDTGIGIAPEHLSLIGQPFVQGNTPPENEQAGTGLGLCLVKSLVDVLGGTFAIVSAPGEGTVVTIRLPVIVAQHATVPAAEPKALAPSAFPPRLKGAEPPRSVQSVVPRPAVSAVAPAPGSARATMRPGRSEYGDAHHDGAHAKIA